ncbi:30S ribosomal protein S2 [Microvenator marinus]|uniref:Small ribosomal subunit protein uS2 n=2 Tax=Microvenator marinus TaxID=2600177 RepID=A0A5B8XMK3_9DELT|nr:30S ribosomal protein S2 [Microvenator marinus]
MEVTMRDLLEAGVHFGHQTNRWNPKMRPYIYGARNGVHVIDLSKTVRLFADAVDYVRQTTSRGDAVLFVGTKRQAQETVKEQAERAGQFYVVNRWLGGALTNFATIKKSIDRLKELDKMSRDGSYMKYTKKEVLNFERERERLNANVGGIQDMKDLPGAMFVLDPKKEEIAVKEARKLGIKVIAVCDTNCDPDMVDYVIPGNDDAIRAIRLFTTAVADACLEGNRMSSKRLEEKAIEAAEDASYHVANADRPGPEVQRVTRGAEATE